MVRVDSRLRRLETSNCLEGQPVEKREQSEKYYCSSDDMTVQFSADSILLELCFAKYLFE